MFQTLTLALSGVNTFRYKQSSETFVGQTSEGRPQGIDWGQPGGSSVVCNIPGHGKGGLRMQQENIAWIQHTSDTHSEYVYFMTDW